MKSHSDSGLVSIGLPVFNGEKYVSKAIESALNQSHDNLELIISDNGSTDNTVGIIKSYASSDARIKILLRPNEDQTSSGDWESYTKKAYTNFQRVLLKASGTYFCWLAHDNFWTQDFLSEALKYIGDGAGAFGGCAMYDHLTGEATELKGMPEIAASISKIEQLRFFVDNRRLGTAAAIYGLFKRKALLAIAPRILSGEPFDWLDLYLVSCLIARHGFTIFSTDDPLIYFGCEGAYVEKPVNGISTNDDIMLRKIRSLKVKAFAREAFANPKSFLQQEIVKRISRSLRQH